MNENSPMTLQYQLRQALLQKIRNGQWEPGDKIPSERELCDTYGVSRMTVREVLKELVHDGFLIRKQGKGTFVAMPHFEHKFTSSYSLSREIEQEGLESHFELQEVKMEFAQPADRKIFGLGNREQVYVITRLRYVGKERFAWEVSRVPQELLRGVTEEQLDKYGLYLSIYQQSGYMAEVAEVESEAINCPPDIAERLHIKKRQAVLHMFSVSRAQDRPISCTESYVRSDLYKYKYRQILRLRNVREGAFQQ